MKKQITRIRSILILVSTVILISGCAAMKKNAAEDSGKMLSASGFKMQLANTPEKLAHLKTLTQRKIVTHERNGKPYFFYADANYCKCLYSGNQDNYQKYQNLSEQQDIAEEAEEAAMTGNLWWPVDTPW